MGFSIITPSFRSSKWLKLCIASVSDQEVEFEHIIQDAGSDDGTLDWLPQDKRVKTFVEKDKGMYDAVNRGLKKSSGEILAYLNCDEQYLPGSLRAVGNFFEQHPSVEIVFGDVIITNPKGELLSCRKSLVPLRAHSMVSGNLSILTCATFFRRSVIEKHGLLFSDKFRALGDADWILRCINKKVSMACLNQITSVFSDTGENLSLKPEALREKKELYESAPGWIKALRTPIILHHRIRKLLAGGYHRRPIQYEIFTLNNPDIRTRFDVAKSSGRWNPYVPEPA